MTHTLAAEEAGTGEGIAAGAAFGLTPVIVHAHRNSNCTGAALQQPGGR